MKTLLSLFALALLLAPPLASAQEGAVTTGIIEAIDAAAGTMTVRSDQMLKPVTFHGIGAAILINASGKPALTNDMAVGMPVTINYAVRNKQWYVSKIVFSETRAAGGTGTGVTGPTTPLAPSSSAGPSNATTGTPTRP